MSVPSNLLYSNPAASEPLLSENQGSQSAVPARMSAKWTQEDPELVDFRVATSSFSSEPIHRFDHVPTATGAKTAKKRNVHSAASSGKFTGEVVDGDPEVEAFATCARVGGAALANYQAGGTRNGLTGKSSYSLSGVGGINSGKQPGSFAVTRGRMDGRRGLFFCAQIVFSLFRKCHIIHVQVGGNINSFPVKVNVFFLLLKTLQVILATHCHRAHP